LVHVQHDRCARLADGLEVAIRDEPTTSHALYHDTVGANDDAGTPQPAMVRIKLKQHAGQTAAAIVQEGRKVKKGQPVGRVEEGKLGATVHSSIDGKVRAVTPDYVEIVA
jgi:biotin carboxyl carrier protein